MLRLRLEWLLLGAMLVVSFGCGGRGDGNTATTSQEDLAEFLEDNPEYSEPPSGAESSKTPLDLGS